MKTYRNWQKRFIFDEAVYFVTCKTEDNYPFFKEQIFCDLFVENLKICKKLKDFYLYGWALIYNHFHLLIKPNDEFNISKIMQSLKRNTSHNINIITGETEGANNYSHLQFRDILNKYKTQFHIKHPNKNPHPKFQWHKSFHDHYIRNDSDFDYHMDYIIWNPQKHKLTDNWQYIFTNPIYEDLVDDSL